jgi:hypothetical protein
MRPSVGLAGCRRQSLPVIGVESSAHGWCRYLTIYVAAGGIRVAERWPTSRNGGPPPSMVRAFHFTGTVVLPLPATPWTATRQGA